METWDKTSYYNPFMHMHSYIPFLTSSTSSHTHLPSHTCPSTLSSLHCISILSFLSLSNQQPTNQQQSTNQQQPTTTNNPQL